MITEYAPTHEPSEAMDNMLLEATKDVATIHLERHIKVKENSWNTDEMLNVDLMAELLPFRNQIILPEYNHKVPVTPATGVGEAVEVFLITEDGIVWYPRDVGHIFNPHNKRPNENDPHEMFVRKWSTEEFQHCNAERDVAKLLNRDMRQLELDRRLAIGSGDVPQPKSSAEGMAYTAIQESNTAAPYKELVSRFRALQTIALHEGKNAAAKIYEVAAAIYTEIANDERLHRSFIAANVGAALRAGNPELATYMLSAIWDNIVHFVMPMQESIPNVRRFVSIRKTGIFTTAIVTKSKLHLVKNVWAIDKLSGLNGKGQELQQKIGDFIVRNSNLVSTAA